MKFLEKIGRMVMSLIGLFVVIIILAVSCDSGDDQVNNNYNNETNTVEQTEEAPKYEFIEGPEITTNEYGNQYITGVIKNNTNTDKGYIQVSFTLYDADGNNIGTAWTNTNNLKSGETWKFEAIILEDDVATFEIDEISGF